MKNIKLNYDDSDQAKIKGVIECISKIEKRLKSYYQI